jgi:hypothetical protein
MSGPSPSPLAAHSPGLCPCSLPSQPGSCWLTDSGDGLAEGHETKAVLEDATAVEEWEGDAHDLLQPILHTAQPGSRGILNLVK